MEAMKWCTYQFKTDGITEKVNQKVESLLQTVMREKDEYQQEKFINTFCEHLLYLESVLLYQRDIHPEQIQNDLMKVQANPQEYIKKVEEVSKILDAEMERLARHFTIFM